MDSFRWACSTLNSGAYLTEGFIKATHFPASSSSYHLLHESHADVLSLYKSNGRQRYNLLDRQQSMIFEILMDLGLVRGPKVFSELLEKESRSLFSEGFFVLKFLLPRVFCCTWMKFSHHHGHQFIDCRATSNDLELR